MAEARRWGFSWLAWSIFALVLVSGGAASWLLYRAMSTTLDVLTEERLNAAGRAVLQALDTDLNGAIDAMRSTALMMGALNAPDEQAWRAFTVPIMKGRTPLRAMDWAPRSLAEQGQDRFPRKLVTPPNILPLGEDLARQPLWLSSSQMARDSGVTVSTALTDFQLRPDAEEVTQPGADGFDRGRGLILVTPVFAPGTTTGLKARRERLRGYVSGLFDINFFMQEASFRADSAHLDLLVFDVSDQRSLQYAQRGEHSDLDPETLEAYKPRPGDLQLSVVVASRSWELVLHPRSSFFAADDRGSIHAFAAVAALVTLLLAAAVFWVGHSQYVAAQARRAA